MEPTDDSDEVRSQRRHFNNFNKSSIFDLPLYENGDGDSKKDDADAAHNGSKIAEEEEDDFEEEKLPAISTPVEAVRYDEEDGEVVEEKSFWEMRNGKEMMHVRMQQGEEYQEPPVAERRQSQFSESADEGLQHKQKRHFVDRNRSTFQL